MKIQIIITFFNIFDININHYELWWCSFGCNMQLQTHFTLTPHYCSPHYLSQFFFNTVFFFFSFATNLLGRASCLYLLRSWSHSCVPVSAFVAKYLIFNRCDWAMFFLQSATLSAMVYKYSGSVEAKTNLIFWGNLQWQIIIWLCIWFENVYKKIGRCL